MKGSFLDDKKILITGGSSGIGKALALLALREGAHVVIVGRRQEVLEEARKELSNAAQDHQVFETMQLDISDEAAVMTAAPQILQKLGGLDILINNAGNAHVGYIENEKLQNYRDMINTNYLGSVYMTHAFLPHFIAQESGHIAFTSSVLGKMGLFGYSAYCGSKFAMTGYADCLRMDLMRYKIKVHICFPPDTDTPQHTEELKTMPAETKAVAGNIRMLPAEFVAREFLNGIEKGDYEILPSFNNKLTMWAVQHLPGISRWCIDHDIRSASGNPPPKPSTEHLATRPATSSKEAE